MMIRLFDIAISLMFLLFLLPFLLPIALVLMFTGEGEIFYRQKRIGRSGQPFNLVKFATMLKDSPNIGAGDITISDDPRILPIGNFLRKTKINELPQLWNILVGDMSIVGPRPMVPNTFANYTEYAQQTLNKVRPGLTGIGSIVFRDEEQFLGRRDDPQKFYNECIAPYKSNLEIWFVKNASFSLYFKIIFVTAWVVVFPSSNMFGTVFPTAPAMPKCLKKQH